MRKKFFRQISSLLRRLANRLETFSQIHQRLLPQLGLTEGERYFREMADAMPQMVWRHVPSGEVDYCNTRFLEYAGTACQQQGTIAWVQIIHPEDLPMCVERGSKGVASEQPFEIELRLKRFSDGAYRWHLAQNVPYRDPAGLLSRWFGAATDIHDQKIATEHLEAEVRRRTDAMRQLETKESQLTRSLAEKDTLFHEMHHRVKNNLQVVSSLLRMQSELLKDPAASAALKESHQRVLSMALIHEQLYSNQELAQINFEDFTQRLAGELFHSYIGETDRVTCRLNTACVYLKLDHAIPLGLILNELITNALKYAYPLDKRGEVMIDLHEAEDRQVSLTISDEGVGLPDNFDPNNSPSMGLPIVHLLTQQIGGRLTVRNRPGAAFTVNFTPELEKVAP